ISERRWRRALERTRAGAAGCSPRASCVLIGIAFSVGATSTPDDRVTTCVSGAEKDDHRGVVDPHQDDDEAAGGAVRRRRAGAPEVHGQAPFADTEQRRGYAG